MYNVSDGISRWSVERYRARIYRYGMDCLFAMFRNFARGEAHFRRIVLDGRPIMIYTKNHRASNVEVRSRATDAYACGGKTMALLPELLAPSSKSASGILPTISMEEMPIQDLVAGGRFKSVISSCDWANANRSDIRMITSELQKHDKIFIFTRICNAHRINNAARWGHGAFHMGQG